MTIEDALRLGTALLADAGISNAGNEAVWILEFALSLDRLALHLKKNEVLGEGDRDRALDLLRRRASREPLQYVLGTQEFCGLEFETAPGVLIPRPETELLVESTRERCAKKNGALIADIGTGSGCIAISLARRLPAATVYATDCSPQALALARRNAERHGVEGRVHLLAGDLFEPLQQLGMQGRFAAIVSNPPYIPEADFATLQPEVRFEPRLALAGGRDGLLFHRRLLRDACPFLEPDGLLVIEVGQGQGRYVSDLAQDEENYYNVRTLHDMAGIERVVLLTKR